MQLAMVLYQGDVDSLETSSPSLPAGRVTRSRSRRAAAGIAIREPVTSGTTEPLDLDSDDSVGESAGPHTDAGREETPAESPPVRRKRGRSLPKPKKPTGGRRKAPRGLPPRVPTVYHPVVGGIADRGPYTQLDRHPSIFVRTLMAPEMSDARGSWSSFIDDLGRAHPAYRAFLEGAGFRHFLSIRPYQHRHDLPRGLYERFYHHTGTFQLGGVEMGPLPLDWAVITGISFSGDPIPIEDISVEEGMELLGYSDSGFMKGNSKTRVSVECLKVTTDWVRAPPDSYLRRMMLRFLYSCFLGSESSTIPLSMLAALRDVSRVSEYDWGSPTFAYWRREFRHFSTMSLKCLHGFWPFGIFWAYDHLPTMRPTSQLDEHTFPSARRWDRLEIQGLELASLTHVRLELDYLRPADVIFQPYPLSILEREEVRRAFALSQMRVYIRGLHSWELFLGERVARQVGVTQRVPRDPLVPMFYEGPGVPPYPDLVIGCPTRDFVVSEADYDQWFAANTPGLLVDLAHLQGGRVLGGRAMEMYYQSRRDGCTILSPSQMRAHEEQVRSVTVDRDAARARVALLETELVRQREVLEEHARVRELNLTLTHRAAMLDLQSITASLTTRVNEMTHQRNLDHAELARLRDRVRHLSGGASTSRAAVDSLIAQSDPSSWGGLSRDSVTRLVHWIRDLPAPDLGFMSGVPDSPSVGYPVVQQVPDTAPPDSSVPPPASQPSQPAQPDQSDQQDTQDSQDPPE